MAEEITVEVPTLGRPVHLGMLYDCRCDALLPGNTVQTSPDTEDLFEVTNKRDIRVNIIPSDSLDAKATALGMRDSLKASCICNLVELTGSARYFETRKSSKQQYRLTVHFKAITRSREMSWKHISKHLKENHECYKQSSATHVVAGLSYGVHAFFVFDRQILPTENRFAVEHNVFSMVKKLAESATDDKGILSLNTHEKLETEKIQCTLFADFMPETNVSNYSEAQTVCLSLPSLLSDSKDVSIPIEMRLCSLSLVYPTETPIREMKVDLISRFQDFFEATRQIEVRCKDLMVQRICDDFPPFGEKLERFLALLQCNVNIVKQKLACILPKVRSRSEDEQEAMNILTENEQSSYRLDLLDHWVKQKEKEINIIKTFMIALSDFTVLKTREDLEGFILDPLKEHIVCFSFPFIDLNDDFLEALSGNVSSNKRQEWSDDQSVITKMRISARSFINFAQANEENQGIKFAVTGLDDFEAPSAESGCIFLYKNGDLLTNDFQPPGKPGKPQIENACHSSILVKWAPPKHAEAAIQNYVIKYAETTQKDASDQDWKEFNTETAETSFRITGLCPGVMYTFFVVPVCRAGFGPASEICNASPTLATSSPTDLKILTISQASITVGWKPPNVIAKGAQIETYVIEYRIKDGSLTYRGEVIAKEETECIFTIRGLQTGAKYILQIYGQCGPAGKGATCEPIEFTTDEKPDISVQAYTADDSLMAERTARNEQNGGRKSKEYLKGMARKLKTGDRKKGQPAVYMLPTVKVCTGKFQSHILGSDNVKIQRHCVIMLVGATGSGKSTLINGIMNYILDVEWNDSFRFKILEEDTDMRRLSQVHSQTKMVVSYTINPMDNLNYKLTIVDTPGFGDTQGIERDNEITNQIHDFFSQSETNGVDHIDSICLVEQATQARLTHTQKYIFDNILSLFGKDMAENIMHLITFADGQDPPVLDAIKHAKIPCTEQNCFKFNNSASFAKNVNSTDYQGHGDFTNDNIDQIFWKMGRNSMEKFLSVLKTTKSRSLTLTKEVLEERKRLEAAVEGLQPQIELGVLKMEELRREQQVLEQYEKEIEANTNFEYEVEIPKTNRIDVEDDYITNCSKCHYTCHYPCRFGNDKDKKRCRVMQDGKCKVCPGKCSWKVHFNQKYRFEYITLKEKRKYAKLEERYRDAQGKKLTVEQVLQKLQEEFDATENRVFELIAESHRSIKRLDEIALKPDPLSVVEYVDLLIDSEKQEGKPGRTISRLTLPPVEFSCMYIIYLDLLHQVELQIELSYGRCHFVEII